MSKTVKILDEFKINYLTQAQYDAEVAGGTVQPDELYLTLDESASKAQTLTNKTIDGANNTVKVTNHNIMREVPKDITEYYTDGTLWDRIAGTNGYSVFEDIYVGDYFQMQKRAITVNNPAGGTYAPGGTNWVQGTQWVTVAGCDWYWGRPSGGADDPDTPEVNYHHLVMVSGKGQDTSEPQHFGRSRMNSSNTTTNGYAGSEMNTTVIGTKVTTTPSSAGNTDTLNKQLKYEFGDHLKVTREQLTSAINASYINKFQERTGAASANSWESCQAVLMGEIEFYGSVAYASSGRDAGTATTWLPLFQQSQIARHNSSSVSFWLKDVVSDAHFARSNMTTAGVNTAGSAGNYVRPRWVIA